MSEIKYEIIEKLGILSESTKGWTKGTPRRVYRLMSGNLIQ